MEALSQIIQAEDNNYRPPHIKYEKPGGFDLLDIKAFEAVGQPHDYFHKLRSQAPVSWWQPPADTDVGGFWSLTRYEDVKNCDLNGKNFSSQAGGILMGYSEKSSGPKNLRAASLDSLINMDQPFHIRFVMCHDGVTPSIIALISSQATIVI